MKVLTLQDVILNVINTDEKVELNVKKMNSLRNTLAENNIFCDFSAGAIETFAYDFPESVQLREFDMKICWTIEMSEYLNNSLLPRTSNAIKSKLRMILLEED